MAAQAIEQLLSLVIVGGFCGVVALALLIDALGMLRKKREIEDRPTSTIRGAARGNVELEGMAVPFPGQPLLRAPFTGRCSTTGWWG